MTNKFTITIKRRNQPQWLIWLIVVMPFAFGTLFNLFLFPSFLKYILDLSWLFLFVLAILNFKKSEAITKDNRLLFIWVICFLVFTAVSYVLSYSSAFYYLWGLRNNFRYYVAFFACIIFLNKDDIGYYFKFFDIFFWLNATICLIQYFLFDIYGDYLGGIFGTDVGCNGYTNLFFVIVTIKSLVYYLNKLESLWVCISKSVIMIVISALAEIKFFYIEFILIVAMAILMTNFSWRKFLIIFVGLFVVIIGYYLLISIFPNSSDFLSIDGILDISASDRGYTSSGDLNRLTSVPIISKLFLSETYQKIFGLGLGNCDTASYDFLTTSFFTQYAHLNYSWFSIAFLFLETGFGGLIFFLGFFVLVFIFGRKTALNGSVQDKIYYQISAILAVCCILIAIYNSSLRTEAGYMAYFVLALPFISSKEQGRSAVEA